MTLSLPTPRRSWSSFAAITLALAGSVSLSSAQDQNGTWTNNTNTGNAWSNSGNWLSTNIANGVGFTADFSTLDISGTRVVNLDSARTLGNLIFGDTDPSGSAGGWSLTNSGNTANFLTLSGTTPTITVNALAGSNTATLNVNLAGTQGLTKAGAGTLTLIGNNTYSGTTTVSAGSLQIGSNSANGNIGSGNVSIASGANVTFLGASGTSTFANTISGAGRVIKSGAGSTLILSGNNTFTGGVAVTAGTLQAYDATIRTGNVNLTNNGGLGATTAGTIGITLSANTVNAALQLHANGDGTSSAQRLTYFSNYSNSQVSLQMSTTGGGGVYNLDVDRADGTSTNKTLVIGGLTTLVRNGTFELTGNNGYSLALNALQLASANADDQNFTLKPLSANLSVGNITSATANSINLVLDGTTSGNAVTGVIANNSVTKVTSVVKNNTSTWAFSGVNTYSGATSVSSGTLLVNGSGSINASSGVSVTGGTFDYQSSVGLNRNVTLNGGTFKNNSAANYTGVLTFTSGRVGGTNLSGQTLTIGSNQTISPANSTGTMSTGALTFASFGTYVWEINNATGTAGSSTQGWDLLNVESTLSLTANSTDKFTINIVSLTSAQIAGLSQNFDAGSNFYWLIADSASTIASFDPNTFALNLSGFANSYDGTWSVARGDSVVGGDASQLYVVYTAVPEPTTWALIGLGALIVITLRRRSVA
jgi:autotransporter-associated beta strand protein